jgi:hypothetical protein
MANTETNNQEPARRRAEAQTVAFVLLWTFVVSFVFLIVINVVLAFGPDKEVGKPWFELMKNSSILLGTALTTVIGYYFGQRESAQARSEARAAETKAVEKEHEVKAEKQKTEGLKKRFDHLAASIPEGMPDNFDAVRSKLPRKR